MLANSFLCVTSEHVKRKGRLEWAWSNVSNIISLNLLVCYMIRMVSDVGLDCLNACYRVDC